jgi:homoserine acetyltransferase
VPTAAPLRVIESPYGHDAFLLEAEAVGNHIRQAVALAERARASRA